MLKELRPTRFTFLLLLVSVCLNGVLGYTLMHRTQTTRAKAAAKAAEGKLTAGTAVPPIQARALSGEQVRIGYPWDKPTLVYVFRPTCAWCERNLPSIKALAGKLKTTHRIVGISLTEQSPVAYVRSKALPFDVYYDVDKGASKAYKMGGTPHTILISTQGAVVRDWLGAYNEPVQTNLEEVFHVRVPRVDARKQ